MLGDFSAPPAASRPGMLARQGMHLATHEAPSASDLEAIASPLETANSERYKQQLAASRAREEQVAEAEGKRLQERQLAVTVGGLRTVPHGSIRAAAPR